MKKKEKFLPVDLGRLEERALAVVEAFDKHNDTERSDEYRTYHLKNAESIARSLASAFRHSFDTYEIGGMIPYGLNDLLSSLDINPKEI